MSILKELLTSLDKANQQLKPNVVLLAPKDIDTEDKQHAHLYRCDKLFTNVDSLPICNDKNAKRKTNCQPIHKEVGKTNKLLIELAEKHGKDDTNICANCIREVYAEF